MNIAFFSEDRMALQAALLAQSALDRHDGLSVEPVAAAAGEAEGIAAQLDAARRGKGQDQVRRLPHVMLALPLAQLGNPAIRERIDLAVVTSGPAPLARQAAERVMASAGAQGTERARPAWMLRCSPWHPGPAGVRILPVTMPALTLDEVASLRSGCPCRALRRRAVALAATLRVAIDDPFAFGFEPADIARAIAGGTLDASATAAEIRLRADLLDLVTDIDDDPDGEPAPTTSRMVLADPHRRSPRPRDRHPNRVALRAPAARHATGCAHAASR